MSITLIIVIITCIVSISAFSREQVIDDLIFYPPAISNDRQYYRFFTCGLIHADWAHLFFNMYSFYSFGQYVETAFTDIFDPALGKLLYILLYVSALAVSILPSYLKNKHNGLYRSLGASGAVSAVIFVFMLLAPTAKISLMFIPIGIPGFLFGILFLVISAWLDKRGGGHINHSAHIFGALYGLAFFIICCNLLSDYPVLRLFIESIRGMGN